VVVAVRDIRTMITVGLPFLNAEATLGYAIGSVFAQSDQNWELILVDDGSVDGSLDIARSVRDNRVRVYSDGRTRGLAARLNQIVDEARGELVARLDADDMMSPRRLALSRQVLSRRGVDLVTSAMAILDRNDQVIAVRGGGDGVANPLALLQARSIAHGPCVGRRRWWQTNRYDSTVMRAEDMELWCRATAAGNLRDDNLVVLDGALYFCREGASVTAGKLLRSHREVRKIIRLYGPRWVGRGATTREVVRSYARSTAAVALAGLGVLTPATVAVRNGVKLWRRGFDELQREVDAVKATAVPGLEARASRQEPTLAKGEYRWR
jgi:glycosyltransferase involved in cell wall biosynthesis